MHNGQLVALAIIALAVIAIACLGVALVQFAHGDRVDPWLALISGLSVRELAGVVRWYEHVHTAAGQPAVEPPSLLTGGE